MKPPPYYDVLVAQHGTTELRPGLHGARVPGVVSCARCDERGGGDGQGWFILLADQGEVGACLSTTGDTTTAV